jgi:hypothetical protein
MFPIGCCISFSGIYVLSKGPEESEDADMERMVDEDEKPAGSPALSSGTSDSSPITSGGSQRERYRSRMSTCAAGPLLGFLNSSTIVDRDNISETIKMRRRSTVRGTSQSMAVRSNGSSKDPSTPTNNISKPKRMSTV